MVRKLFLVLVLISMFIVACTEIEPEPTLQPTQEPSRSTVMETTSATASLTPTTAPSNTPRPTATTTLSPTPFLTATPHPTVTPPSTQFSHDFEAETTDNKKLEILNQIGGAVTSVAVQDNRAYISVGARLAVADIADPANPFIISWSNILPAIVSQITLDKNLAYVTMGEAGLWIFDVSDSATFQLIGQVQTTNPARHFVLRNNVAYVVNYQRGTPDTSQVMSIVDVSDPSQPQEVNTLPLPLPATKMIVADDYLYISFYPYYYGYEDAFWILDLADPLEPELVADIPELAGRDMALTNQSLVIARGGSLTFADVSDPAHPQKIVESPNLMDYANINAVVPNGDSLFALNLAGDAGYCGGTLYAFDLAHSDDVERLDDIYVDCGVYDMVVVDDLLYLATDHALRIMDVHTPTALSYIGDLPTTPPMEEIEAGDYLFGLGRAGNSYQIFTFDVDNPGQPLLLSQFGVDYLVNDFAANGTYTYLATYWAGLAAVDMTDPFAPYIMAEIDFDNPVENSLNLVLSDGRLYASLDRNLGIFNPLTLAWLGGDGEELYGRYKSFVVSENILWTGGTTNSLQAFDVTIPDQIQSIADLEQVAPTSGKPLFVDQDFLYFYGLDCGFADRTFCEDGTLTIVDIADPEAMFVTGMINVPGQVQDMAKLGDTLILIGGDLWLVDVANPNQPQLISHFKTPGYAEDIAIINDTIYLTDGIGGLLILKMVN